MGKLSTHVLDTAAGKPAAGVVIELWALPGAGETEEQLLVTAETNEDGRTDAPLLTGGGMRRGRFRLVFAVGDYFRARGNGDAGAFLDRVPVEFRIDDPEAGYHVPLLVTPWSYTTYRGS